MTNAITKVNGQAHLPTILGQCAPRICVAGKIRAGIKVLTKAAAGNSKAQVIYKQGVAEGKPFEDIEREIAEAAPDLKHPLVPKNVPYFTVRAGDFPNRDIAQQILNAHGEDRGDGVRRLYRFPVVFPADTWQSVMPHELVAWGASGRKYWSEYSPDGRVRFCKCYAPVPKNAEGKRAIRLFGGRKSVLRKDYDGLCEPEACGEYQRRECNLGGRFIFYIPGIQSIDAIELATNSFYAMNNAIRKFETIAFMRGGSVAGFLDERGTSFWLTKKLTEVPHIDEDGRPVRVKHWLIELEAPVDVTALLRANEEDEHTLAKADRAAQVLEGSRVTYEAGEGDGQGGMNEGGAAEPPNAQSANAAQRAQSSPSTTATQARPAAPADAAPKSPAGQGGAAEPGIDAIAAALSPMGIDPARYEAYATKRWGSGWKLNANGRRRALEEIEGFAGDAKGLLAKIDAEVDVFA